MSRAPTHPGAILREDVFPSLDVNVSEAARELGVSRQTLHRILNEQTSITPEMAVRLGKYCGNGPGLWLRLQLAYDLWQAEAALERELKAIPDRSRSRIKQLSRESKARIGSKRWNRGDLHER